MPTSTSIGKKAANILLSTDAKAPSIIHKQVCEQNWQPENADFIATYNRILEQESLPLQEWQTF